MCECYQIGGPFIAEDPECPEHGHRAVAEREATEEKIARLEARVLELEDYIKNGDPLDFHKVLYGDNT